MSSHFVAPKDMELTITVTAESFTTRDFVRCLQFLEGRLGVGEIGDEVFEWKRQEGKTIIKLSLRRDTIRYDVGRTCYVVILQLSEFCRKPEDCEELIELVNALLEELHLNICLVDKKGKFKIDIVGNNAIEALYRDEHPALQEITTLAVAFMKILLEKLDVKVEADLDDKNLEVEKWDSYFHMKGYIRFESRLIHDLHYKETMFSCPSAYFLLSFYTSEIAKTYSFFKTLWNTIETVLWSAVEAHARTTLTSRYLALS